MPLQSTAVYVPGTQFLSLRDLTLKICQKISTSRNNEYQPEHVADQETKMGNGVLYKYVGSSYHSDSEYTDRLYIILTFN